MPGYDGHTLCRHLRSSPTTENLVIIASSAAVFADDQRLPRSGANDFYRNRDGRRMFEILGRHLKLKVDLRRTNERRIGGRGYQ